MKLNEEQVKRILIEVDNQSIDQICAEAGCPETSEETELFYDYQLMIADRLRKKILDRRMSTLGY